MRYDAAGQGTPPTGLWMKKLLIIITCFASLIQAGCYRLHIVHRIDIQQGNVVTQEKVNQLVPGMNRNQVQFVMGSPMIVDVFHQDRWDYIYYLKAGYAEAEEQRVTLYFEDDALARIEGTLEPSGTPVPEDELTRQETIVVPAQERVAPGLLNRIWHWITFRSADEDNP